MKVRNMAILFVIGVLFLCQNISASSKVSPNVLQGTNTEFITPLWENTNDVKLDLYFLNGKAECISIVNGISSTSNISATFKLERKGLFGWSLVKTWSKSSNGDSLSFYETESVAKGYTYRLSITAKVTSNGVMETVSTSVERKY